MYFELSIYIERPPQDVFAFMRDKDKYPQKPGSAVLVLDQITPGEAGVGTRYREVVRMLPFYDGQIFSEITRFEPPQFLEEDFNGPGMVGHLAYQFLPEGSDTRMFQREHIRCLGLLKLFSPLIRRVLARQLQLRLEEIKRVLEGGWIVG